MEDVKLTLAYLAGIIDGEGSIMIVRAKHEAFMKQYDRNYPYYLPCVRVGMIDKEPIQLICDVMNMGEVENEVSYQNKRPMFRWRVTNREQCAEVINRLLPYLRVKKPQALLMLDFIKNFKRCHRYNPMTPEIEAERHNYWVQMRTLNGIASPATTERAGKTGRCKSVRLESTV